MLKGNKFNQVYLNAPALSGEKNYTDWTTSAPSGSSYGSNFGNAFGNRISRRFGSVTPADPYAHLDTGTNNPYQTIDHYKQTLGAVGEVAPPHKGQGLGNALMTVLDLMQRPQYAVTNVLDEITDDTKSSFKDVLMASLQGWTGKRTSSIKDTFDNLGVLEQDSTKKWYQGSNLARNVVGLAGDVLLDPATYFTAGTASIAKGLGAKTLKSATPIGKTLEKALRETGTNAFDVSRTQIIDDVSKFLTPYSKNPVTMAQKQDSIAQQIEKALSMGNAEDKNLASRIAYALTQATDQTNKATLSKNRKIVQDLIDDGTSKINRDIAEDAFGKTLGLELGALEVGAYANAAGAFTRTVGQSVVRKITPVFEFTKGTDWLKKDIAYKLDDIFTVGRTTTVPKEVKQQLVTDVYGLAGKTGKKSLAKEMTDMEYDILNVLYDAFAPMGSAINPNTMLESAQKLAKTSKKTRGKLHEVTEELKEVTKDVKRVKGGIEFGNGLQRVFDQADHAFYIKYHNPFTNKVVPLFDITSVAKSGKARAAWQTILEANPISPVMHKVAHLGVGVANKFQTEYISRNIAKMADGTIDTTRYDAAKKIARMVTGFSRKETALAHRSVNSLRIFNKINGFFESPELRKAASLYIERNNDEFSMAAWLYVTGQGLKKVPADADGDLIRAAYAMIENSGSIRKSFDALKESAKSVPVLKKIASQNTAFNTAIAQLDGTNKIWFGDELAGNRIPISTDNLLHTAYLQKAAAGQIDETAASQYARIYTNYDERLINPSAPSRPVRKGMPLAEDELKRSGELGAAVDTRAASTSGDTGAFHRRKNRSAAEAYITSGGQAEIEFDLALRVARRNLESERVVLNTQFVSSIEDARRNIKGLDTLISDKQVAGFKRIMLMDGNYVIYAHPEISNQLSRIVNVFDQASLASSAVDSVALTIANALKTMQTTYNPSFILRNSVGEPLMNWIAGVTRQSHELASQIMKDMSDEGLFKIGDTTFGTTKTGTKRLYREYIAKTPAGVNRRVLEYVPKKSTSPMKYSESAIDLAQEKKNLIQAAGVKNKTYTIGGKEYTSLEIIDEFYDAGLGWSGVTRGNTARNMRALVEEKMVPVASRKGVKATAKTIHEKVSKPGDFIETWTRLAQFIDCLENGMDKFAAAREVRKFHVDYKDLTLFERKYMRNLMPYYTYMRKNVPIQFKLLLERQNKINIIGQLVDSMYEAVEADNGGNPLIVPDYLKEGIAIPLNVDDEGNVQYLNWGVPVADIGRFKYNMREMLMENFFSMWSPLVKAPLEYSTNQNMMYGSDLERYEGQGHDLLPGVEGSPKVGTLANQMIQSMGIVNTARNALASGISSAQQTGNIAQSALMGVQKLATGSFMPNKSQSEVGLQQAYDYRDQLYAHIQQLRAKGIPVPQYTPNMKKNPLPTTPMTILARVNQEGEKGYLGTPNTLLYPDIFNLKKLSGR